VPNTDRMPPLPDIPDAAARRAKGLQDLEEFESRGRRGPLSRETEEILLERKGLASKRGRAPKSKLLRED
jgi:hypothetical protein